MIKYIQHGNIFDSQAQVLVNPVNCVGVMGKGLALQFKERFGPEYFTHYQHACNSKLLRPGQLYLHAYTTPWILDFPTKDHYLNPSQIMWIREGLHFFVRKYKQWTIHSIAFPRLGSGLGGLEWHLVRGQMEDILHDLPIDIEIYE